MKFPILLLKLDSRSQKRHLEVLWNCVAQPKLIPMMRDITDIVYLHTAGELEIGHCSPDDIETCDNKYGNR